MCVRHIVNTISLAFFFFKKNRALKTISQASKIKVIFVSFETLRRPRTADVFIEAWRQSLQSWQTEVVNHLRAEATQSEFIPFS